MPSLESRIPPPAVVLVLGGLMWLVSRAAPSLQFDLPGHSWLPVVLVSAGFLIGIAGVVTFRRAKTTVDPMKPRASSLVTWGVYAISRNPMYLGGLVMLLGWALFLSNVLGFLFLPAYILYINRFQIAPEERALTGCLERRTPPIKDALDDGCRFRLSLLRPDGVPAGRRPRSARRPPGHLGHVRCQASDLEQSCRERTSAPSPA